MIVFGEGMREMVYDLLEAKEGEDIFDEHLVDEEANTDLHISYARVHTAHQAPDMAVGFRGSDRYFIQKYEAQAYRWDEEAEMWVPDESNLSEILN